MPCLYSRSCPMPVPAGAEFCVPHGRVMNDEMFREGMRVHEPENRPARRTATFEERLEKKKGTKKS